jgi:hypothetical protein
VPVQQQWQCVAAGTHKYHAAPWQQLAPPATTLREPHVMRASAAVSSRMKLVGADLDKITIE